MKEKEIVTIGGVKFRTSLGSSNDPLIIGSFGRFGSGKTRFPFTGPPVVGAVVYEKKSRYTIQKHAEDEGKTVLMPELDLTDADTYKLDKMKEDDLKKFYRGRVDLVKSVFRALNSEASVGLIMCDTFGQFCTEVKFANHGRSGKFKRIGERVFQDNSEPNQEIIDVMNSFDKHVILTHKSKDEWSNDAATGRLTWEGFKFLGNHVNVLIEHEYNEKWNPDKPGSPKFGWHYRLNVRQCQFRTELQGPEGNPLLEDEMITFLNLALQVRPDLDPEEAGLV